MYMYRPHTFFDVATSKFPGTRLKVKNLASYPQVLRNNLNFLRPKISLFLKKGCKNKNSESFDWFYGTRKIFLEKKTLFLTKFIATCTSNVYILDKLRNEHYLQYRSK